MACETERAAWLAARDARLKAQDELDLTVDGVTEAVESVQASIEQLQKTISAGESLVGTSLTAAQASQLRANLQSYYDQRGTLLRQIGQLRGTISTAKEAVTKANTVENAARNALEECVANDISSTTTTGSTSSNSSSSSSSSSSSTTTGSTNGSGFSGFSGTGS